MYFPSGLKAKLLIASVCPSNNIKFLPDSTSHKYIFLSDDPDARIFPVNYAAARIVVKKAGNLVGIILKPHDLRRHAATYASRSGTPLEIVEGSVTAFELGDHPEVPGQNQ